MGKVLKLCSLYFGTKRLYNGSSYFWVKLIDIWSIVQVEQLSLENSKIGSKASDFDNFGLCLHNVSSVIEQLDEKWKQPKW